MKTLRELYSEHHGKLSDKWSSYLDAYEEALRPWRTRPVRMLEIGIQNGGSMEIWPKYFPEGHVFIGCDIDQACAQLRYSDPRVNIIVGDANEGATQQRILRISDEFDIVIDDGSHTSSDIVRSFARYFGRVVDGGVFIVEDLHCGYWGWREGGLHHPFSSMAFLKLLVDVVHHEHWGIPAARRDLIAGFSATYGISVDEELLAKVHSVSFANSLCFIRKEPASANVLGTRVFAGEEDLVVPDLRRRPEVVGMRADEAGNPYSHPVTPPAERIDPLQRQIASVESELAREQASHRETRNRAGSLERRAERAEQLALDRLMHLQAVLGSTSWRMVSKLHPVLNRLKGVRSLEPPGAAMNAAEAAQRQTYQEWLDYEAQHAVEDSRKALDDIAAMGQKPLISVLMPVFNPPEALLRKAIASVRSQLYPNWELCIADDASTLPHVRAVLDELASADSRIQVTYRPANGHIAEASNTALQMAGGEFVALLDHDDELHPFALYRIAQQMGQHPDIDLFYTDEDKIDERGQRSQPYFKCDFNYELLLSHNMVCHLGAYRLGIAREIGGFCKGLEGAQDYDFALRFIERVGRARVGHIPRVLYHWRMHAQSTATSASAKPYAIEASRRAVKEHLQRTGVRAEILAADAVPEMNRVRYELPASEPSVDIVIPTRDRADLLEMVLGSLFGKTKYRNFRVIVVDNGSVEKKTHELLAAWTVKGRVEVLRVDAPFNFSHLNNAAVARSNADFVLLLNNDIEITRGNWLTEMVGQAIQPGVGCVGARLWYPDGRLQHGGVVLGVGGVAGHAHKYAAKGDLGYFGRAVLQQSYSAVTAACLLVRRTVYLQVGGLDERLQVAFNDVDFCLRVREAGYRNVWTPYAELVHHESVSRGYEDTPAKQERFQQEVLSMQARWRDVLLNDPAYSRHLTLEHEDFSLRAGEPRDLW